MSDEQITAPEFGTFDITYAATWTLGRQIPASEDNSEDVGALSLRYVDGAAQLVTSGGKYIPAGLAVVYVTGDTVATYAAGPATGDVAAQSRMDMTSEEFSLEEYLALCKYDPSAYATAGERALSLHYVDGAAQLVVGGGTAIPAVLTVVDGSGGAVATYTAGPEPEDIATLAIEYRDGKPVIIVSGGTLVPGGITVEDESGNTVAEYSGRASARPFIFTNFSLGGTLSPTLANYKG